MNRTIFHQASNAHDFEPVLFVERLEHGQGELPVELQPSLVRVHAVVDAAGARAQVATEFQLGAVNQNARRLQPDLRQSRLI